MIAAIIIVVLLVLVVGWLFAQYNRLIKLRNLVTEAWAQIDVELTRRHDLTPNLIATVKGYAAHEATTLQDVTNARAAAVAVNSAAPAARVGAEDTLTNSLGRLIAISENYPDLKADSAFLNLQHQLTDTEDRIAASRRLYNGNVRALNTALETVPTNMIANTIGGFTKEDYFEATDATVRDVPTVSF